MSRQTNAEARAQALIDELKAAASEAAGVRKDLERAMKEARAQIDEYLHDETQKALDATTADIQALADAFAGTAHEDMQGWVTRNVKRAQDAVERACSIQFAAELLAAKLAPLVRVHDGKSGLDYNLLVNPDAPDGAV